MARRFTIPFNKISVAATQDLFNGKAVTYAFRIWGITIGQDTSTTGQVLAIRLQRIPTTYTAGSGGAAATLGQAEKGDAAPSATCRVNDTTGATTSGTAVTLLADTFNSAAGYSKQYVPEHTPWILPNDGFAFQLLDAPSPSLTCSGFMECEEIG